MYTKKKHAAIYTLNAASNQLLVVDPSHPMAGLLAHRRKNRTAFPSPVTEVFYTSTPGLSVYSDKFAQASHLFPFSSAMLISIEPIQFDIP